MAAPKAFCLALGVHKYAVCPHGRDHSGWCMCAHKTSEILFPAKFIKRMWSCKAHESRGHPGIDLFVGQDYIGSQYDRVIQMVHAETLPLAAQWARMFVWFKFYGKDNEYITETDLGWYHVLQEYKGISSTLGS